MPEKNCCLHYSEKEIFLKTIYFKLIFKSIMSIRVNMSYTNSISIPILNIGKCSLERLLPKEHLIFFISAYRQEPNAMSMSMPFNYTKIHLVKNTRIPKRKTWRKWSMRMETVPIFLMTAIQMLRKQPMNQAIPIATLTMIKNK